MLRKMDSQLNSSRDQVTKDTKKIKVFKVVFISVFAGLRPLKSLP